MREKEQMLDCDQANAAVHRSAQRSLALKRPLPVKPNSLISCVLRIRHAQRPELK
jgi:hypothetical protein